MSITFSMLYKDVLLASFLYSYIIQYS